MTGIVMIDWQWIPGTVLAASAAGHSAWLRHRFDTEVKATALRLQRQIMDQYMHGLQLWPRPWMGNRPLTQIEEITKPGYGWDGFPYTPEQQIEQMQRDAQRLIDSYGPRGEPEPEVDDAGDS